MNYGYRYLHPENVVLSPAPLRSTSYYAHLPNNECTAYYSKLSKTFALRNVDEPQYLPHTVPHCYAHYAAPEVQPGHVIDLRKATAYSFGVMLYDALRTMPGIDHIVTNVSRTAEAFLTNSPRYGPEARALGSGPGLTLRKRGIELLSR